MEKFSKDYPSMSPALDAGSTLANMDKIPYYIFKNTVAKNFKLTNSNSYHGAYIQIVTIHPFEPSEMTNKENGDMK